MKKLKEILNQRLKEYDEILKSESDHHIRANYISRRFELKEIIDIVKNT